MRCLIFSDGHIGDYSEGNTDPHSGLNTRLLDTLRVWNWVHDLAVERKVDLVIFGGDRFRSNRPPAWMRDMADAVLSRFGLESIKIACLLGNHDLFDKSGRYNSWNGVQVWSNYPHLYVFDEPGQLKIEGINFHFLPFGYSTLGYEVTGNRNILIFHDEVRGLSSYGPITASGGLEPEVVDKSEFMCVFGGHVHLRQELALQKTIGIHIGSPLERVEDGDQGPKGAIIAEIDEEVSLEFVQSPLPKIVRLAAEWDKDISGLLEQLLTSPIPGNVVLLTVTHDGSATPKWRRKLEEAIRGAGATSVRVELRLAEAVSPSEIATPVVQPQATLPDQLIDYVRSTRGDTLVPYMREILEKAAMQ